MSKLYVKRLSETATIPTRGSSESAGLDLYAADDIVLAPGSRHIVPTNIAFGIPEGYYIRIAPRSGLAVKFGIEVLAGVVDSDYTGHIQVVLINLGTHYFSVEIGDRIAQAILEKIDIPELIEIDDLEDTERGSKGFGSTGV